MQEHALTDRQFADLPGGRTAYVSRGSGPALVLVHGVGLNASVWLPQLDAFSRDHRVVAYDTLGHGGSDRPAADAGLPDYARQLEALLDELGIETAVLLGHSMGALIATLFAIEHPRRVERLIAANPVYRRPAGQLAASRARALQIEERGPSANLDEAVSRWFGDPAAVKPSRVEQVRRWLNQADRLGYARAYRVFSEADPWLTDKLGELRVPVMFVTGALDPNSTPGMSRAMAAQAPLGYARVLDGERHMMAYASPARFNSAVREFLYGNDARGHAASRSSGTRAKRA